MCAVRGWPLFCPWRRHTKGGAGTLSPAIHSYGRQDTSRQRSSGREWKGLQKCPLFLQNIAYPTSMEAAKRNGYSSFNAETDHNNEKTIIFAVHKCRQMATLKAKTSAMSWQLHNVFARCLCTMPSVTDTHSPHRPLTAFEAHGPGARLPSFFSSTFIPFTTTDKE